MQKTVKQVREWGVLVPRTTIRTAPGGFHPRYLELCCPTHRRSLHWDQVDGKIVEGHKCDDRCMGARGHKCECSCGGANHGRGFHVEIRFN